MDLSTVDSPVMGSY